MKSAIVAMLLSLSFNAWAATLTSVTCTASGAASVTNPNTCSTGTTGNPNSNASSVASVSADLLTYTLNQTVFANFAGSSFTQTSTASAAAEVTLNLTTPGAVRSGFLRLTYTPNWLISPADFSGTLGVSVGSVSASCGITIFPSCVFPLVTTGTSAPLIPFTLGQSFLLDIKQLTTATGEFAQGSSQNIANTSIGFQLFDTDGVTRVAVSEVPEPASWLLIAVAGAALSIAYLCPKRGRGHH